MIILDDDYFSLSSFQWGDKNSPSKKSRTKRPITVAKKTKTARSWLFIIPIRPVKKAPTLAIPAKRPGRASVKLLKKVAPPRWPKATRRRRVVNNKKKITIKPTDHLPKIVLGIKEIFIISIDWFNLLIPRFPAPPYPVVK